MSSLLSRATRIRSGRPGPLIRDDLAIDKLGLIKGRGLHVLRYRRSIGDHNLNLARLRPVYYLLGRPDPTVSAIEQQLRRADRVRVVRVVAIARRVSKIRGTWRPENLKSCTLSKFPTMDVHTFDLQND